MVSIGVYFNLTCRCDVFNDQTYNCLRVKHHCYEKKPSLLFHSSLPPPSHLDTLSFVLIFASRLFMTLLLSFRLFIPPIYNVMFKAPTTMVLPSGPFFIISRPCFLRHRHCKRRNATEHLCLLNYYNIINHSDCL